MQGDQVNEMKEVFHELDKDGSGTLNFDEVTELAKRFFDGRTPTEGRVSKIFRQLGAAGGGEISIDEMISGAQAMHRAFHVSAELHHDHLLDPVTEEDSEEESAAAKAEEAAAAGSAQEPTPLGKEGKKKSKGSFFSMLSPRSSRGSKGDLKK